MERLAHFVLRHRRMVMLAWLVMFIIGIGAAAMVPDRLTVDFSLPGQQGYETSKEILDRYGNGGPTSNNPVIVTATVPQGQTVSDRAADIEPVLQELREAIPEARVADLFSADEDLFLTEDQRTTWAYVYPKEFENFSDPLPDNALQPALDEANESTDIDWTITGYGTLAAGEGADEESGDSALLIEVLLGGVGALVVLTFLFASLLALVPLRGWPGPDV